MDSKWKSTAAELLHAIKRRQLPTFILPRIQSALELANDRISQLNHRLSWQYPVCYFDPGFSPARIQTQIAVTIPANQTEGFCRELYGLTVEKLRGAVYIALDYDKSEARHRYEWPVKLSDIREEFRAGIELLVKDGAVHDLQAWVSTHEHIQERMPKPPQILLPVRQRLFQQIIETVRETINRIDPVNRRSWHVLLHVSIPGQKGIRERLVVGKGDITLLPTVVLVNGKKHFERVSAIIVTREAGSPETARTDAIAYSTRFCALCSLAMAAPVNMLQVPWGRRFPEVRYVDSPARLSTGEVYPAHVELPERELSTEFAAKIIPLWDAFIALNDQDRGMFAQAAVAYHEGLELMGKHSALAIVSYLAALDSLAQPEIERCTGDLNCDKCGSLNFRHNLIGEVPAMLRLIERLTPIPDEQRKQVKIVLGRLYREHRSSFVHSAVSRFTETLHGPPAQLPESGQFVSRRQCYEDDLLTAASISRRTLLAWVFERAQRPFPGERYDAVGIKVQRTPSAFAMHIRGDRVSQVRPI